MHTSLAPSITCLTVAVLSALVVILGLVPAACSMCSFQQHHGLYATLVLHAVVKARCDGRRAYVRLMADAGAESHAVLTGVPLLNCRRRCSSSCPAVRQQQQQ
jgi:hypothetical protein